MCIQTFSRPGKRGRSTIAKLSPRSILSTISSTRRPPPSPLGRYSWPRMISSYCSGESPYFFDAPHATTFTRTSSLSDHDSSTMSLEVCSISMLIMSRSSTVSVTSTTTPCRNEVSSYSKKRLWSITQRQPSLALMRYSNGSDPAVPSLSAVTPLATLSRSSGCTMSMYLSSNSSFISSRV